MLSQPNFRAGQRVRIKPTADSEFAGYIGTIIYVGSSLCDVRIRYRTRRSRTYKVHIDSFHKHDLEDMNRKLDLVSYATKLGKTPKPRNRTLWFALSCIVIVLLIVFLLTQGA